MTNRFAVALETLAELTSTAPWTLRSSPPPMPNLREILAEFAPLPRATLFLGLAMDGWPVLLNLLDPVPGPLLIVGDPGSGKTALLRVIARAVDETEYSEDVRYLVVTDRPEEWKDFEHSSHCEEILDLRSPSVADYLISVTDWAHSNKGGQHIILLLIDNLAALTAAARINQPLSWLLARGPSNHIWPISTLGASSAADVPQWLESFHTRLLGRIENDRNRELIVSGSNAPFHKLMSIAQFAMRERNDWLPFWVPGLD